MRRILIVAGIHGDEPSGPYAAFEFLQLLRHRSRKPEVVIDVIPLINVSGFIAGTRENNLGQDLNRCFQRFRTVDDPPACRMVWAFLEKSEPYDLLVSLHEDLEREEFYLYDFGCGQLSPLVQDVFAVVQNQNHRVRLYTGVDDEELGNVANKGYIGIRLGKNDSIGIGSLEDLAAREGKAKQVLILEIPGRLPLDKKINLAVDILKTIIEQ